VKFDDSSDVVIYRDADNPIIRVAARDRKIGSASILRTGRRSRSCILDFEFRANAARRQ
jgi:hypothetical protein